METDYKILQEIEARGWAWTGSSTGTERDVYLCYIYGERDGSKPDGRPSLANGYSYKTFPDAVRDAYETALKRADRDTH